MEADKAKRPVAVDRFMKRRLRHCVIRSEATDIVALLGAAIALIGLQQNVNGAESGADTSPIGTSLQMAVVVTRDWAAVDGMLQRYARAKPKEAWHPVGPKV